MRSAEIYNFSSPYSTDAINLVKIGLIVLEKISLKKKYLSI